MQVKDHDIVLSLEGVSKKFCRKLKRSLLYGAVDVARSMAGIRFDTTRLRKEEFWALDDISFELRKGMSIGVVGTNGAGKSTLLRLITGIFAPDCGKVTVRGRVGSLISLGAGFHPHLTGRENIFLNGTIVGMTRDELHERYDDIIRFADIGEFIDTPVSTYSSGMRVRLGFSIAIHASPDILVIDEVLSVGDAQFMKKSYERIDSMIHDRDVTAIVVSHNMGTIQRLCDNTLILNKGVMVFRGRTSEAISRYSEICLGEEVCGQSGREEALLHHPECQLTLHADTVAILDGGGNSVERVFSGQPVNFEIRVKNTLSGPVAMPTVSILILNTQLTELYTIFHLPASMAKAHGTIAQHAVAVCRIPFLGLAPGTYKIIIKIGSEQEGVFDSAIVNQELLVIWSEYLTEQSSTLYTDYKFVMPAEWELRD